MSDEAALTPLSEVRRLIQSHVRPLDSRTAETADLLSARGRICAAPIVAPVALPEFDHSAMDGFAVRSADTVTADRVRLRVLGAAFAGKAADRGPGPQEAVRIMTGAPMPPGADAVIPFEQCDVEQEGQVVATRAPIAAFRNVRRAGEEYAKGATAIDAGVALRAAELALCAAFGLSHVSVLRRPRVGILSTGDELVAPGVVPGPGQRVSSNAVALSALVEEGGGAAVQLGIVPDDQQALEAALRGAKGLDVVVSTGGVSAGDRDYVCAALAGCCDVHHRFHIAMKPGKPFAFGVRQGVLLFALAGNPAAAMVSFAQLVVPALRRLSGRHDEGGRVARATLDGTLRAAKDRVVFFRAVAEYRSGELVATPLPHQGAGSMRSMLGVNALIVVEPQAGELRRGSTVNVELLGF